MAILILLAVGVVLLQRSPPHQARNLAACGGVREAAAALQTHVVRVVEDDHTEPFKITCTFDLGPGKRVFEALTFGGWSNASFRQTRNFFEGSYRVVGVPRLGDAAFAATGNDVTILQVLAAPNELEITAPGRPPVPGLARLANGLLAARR